MSTSQQSGVESQLSILTALRDRFNAARRHPPSSTTTYIYPFNAVTLPTGTAGNPGRILTLLTQTTNTTLEVTSANEPVLNAADNTLNLEGTASLLGMIDASITVTLTVSANSELEVTLRLNPPSGWTLADTFQVLTDTAYDYLPLQQPVFSITSYTHSDAAIFYPLQPGLQFQATLVLQSSFLPITRDPGQQGLQTRSFGGVIDVSADGRPQFAFVGQNAFAPLTVNRVGQPALTLQNGMLSLRSTRTTDVNANLNELVIAGTVAIGNHTLPCTVTLPTAISSLLTLTTGSPIDSLSTLGGALTLVGVDDLLPSRLPTGLQSLAGATLSNITLQFDPTGNQASVTTLSVRCPGPWQLVPSLNLTLSDLTFQASVSRSSSYGMGMNTAFSAEVSGMLTLGQATTYQVQAGVPLSGPWYVEITDTSNVPTLETIIGLFGLNSDAILNVLPGPLRESLRALGAFTIKEVFLTINPFDRVLDEISFTITQVQDWPVVGTFLTVSDWNIEMSVANPTKQPSGTLRGNIVLAAGGNSTTLNIVMPVPSAQGSWWTLALAEDDVIRIPSIGQILALFGGRVPLLPQNITSPGALDVTLFTVTFDPINRELKHLAFAGKQAGDWPILPSDQLTITGVTSAFSFLPETSQVKAYGYVEGLVTIAGTQVEVLMLKNTYEGDWLLEAGYNSPVHVPGFSALDNWLSPTSAQSYLPSTFPLANGFDFSKLQLQFDGSTGGLKHIAFEIHVGDRWTILPGKLWLNLLQAQLSMPYPIHSDQISGYITGFITLTQVDILLTANKPTSTDTDPAHWTFSGSLENSFTIDLIAALNGLAQRANFALPGDITSYGFPQSITIESASVWAVPDTGRFHFEGSAGFNWNFPFGLQTLSLLSVGATIDILQRGAELTATVWGTFDFAGIHATPTLSIGTQQADTILTAAIKSAAAPNIQTSQITDGLSANSDAEKWAQLVPTDLSSLSFASAALYLNLTSKRFLLYGDLHYGQAAAIASAIVFCERQERPAGPIWNYIVALAAGDGFRFAQIFERLAVIDNYLRVRSAHVVICNITDRTLGTLAQTTTTLLSTIAPRALSPLAGLADATLALQRGVFFVAELDFATQTIFSNILQIGNTTTPPGVRLSALIDHVDSTRSVFSADLPDITILNTILLTKTASYPGIHLTYSPGKQDEFQLAGEVQTSLFGSNFNFDVMLTINNTRLTSDLKQTSQELNPFGLPGITFAGLALSVQYTFAQPSPPTPKSSQFTLQGHVLFGSPPQPGKSDERLSFLGKLALVNGSPALISIAIDRDFSIGRFLAQCITGDGASWPANFIDVAFLNGTRIYYYAQENDPGGALASFEGYRYTEDGFNIDARVRLTLITELSLHGIVHVLRDPTPTNKTYRGIQVAIRLDTPLDLVFLELAGTTRSQPATKYEGGPLLGFETGSNRRFVVSTGINFLSSPFVTVDVAISKNTEGHTQFDGHLKAEETVTPFGQLECDFTYIVRPGQSNQLRINNWPSFTWLRNLIDFAQTMKDLYDTSGGSACGQLTNLIANAAYQTTFTLHPSVASDGDDLVFTFTGSYMLTIVGANSPFLTVELPQFDIRIPKTTTYKTLPETLAQKITAGSAQFVRDLLRQPEKIALFLAMIFGPNALSIALQLACNGLVDSAVPAAAEVGADAIAVAGGALAVGATAAAASAIATSIANHSGSSGGDPSHPQTPVLKTLIYANSAIVGTWQAASYAAGYTFEVLKPDGTSLAARDFGYHLSGSIPVNASSLLAGIYQGRVKSTRGNLSSAWSTLTLLKPAAPMLQLGYENGTLIAAWPDLQVDTYVVQFYDPQHQQLGNDQTTAGLTALLSLPEHVTGVYTARARAVKNNAIPGDWSTETGLNIMPAPTNLRVQYINGQLLAQWDANSGSFEIVTRTGDTIVATTTSTINSARLSPLPGQEYRIGITYTLAVRTRDRYTISSWTSLTFTVIDVAAITNLTLYYEAGQLFVTWDPVIIKDGSGTVPVLYIVELLEGDNRANVLGTLTNVAQPNSTIARSDGQAMVDGQRYAVRVRVVAQNKPGPWSDPVEIVILTLPAPTELQLAYTHDQLQASWHVTEPQFLLPYTGLQFDGLFNMATIAPHPSLTTIATWEVWFWPDEQLSYGVRNKRVFWRAGTGLEGPWEHYSLQTTWQDGQISVGVAPPLPPGARFPVDPWYSVSVPDPKNPLREQPYPSRKWYHVAGVVTSGADGYKLLLYINGEFKGATNALPAPVRDNTASGWVIGSDSQSSATAYLGGINFKGKICEVRLWSSSRSQTDIQASMHRRLTGTEEGLVGYWPLNDGHGDRAFDHSVGGVAAQLGDKDAGKVIPGWIPGNNPASTLPTWPSDNPTYDFELYTAPWLIPPASLGLSFDGRYNKGIAGLPSLPPDELSEATWEVWFRPDEQNGQKKVLWHEEPAGWQTIWQDGQISVGVYPGAPGESKPGPAVTQWYFASAPGDHITTSGMQWYHVAGVLGAGKLLLYIDGQVRGSVDCPPFETGLFNLYKGGLNIGSGTRTGEGFNFKGQISEVRLWKIARRQQDIAASMHSRLAGNEEGLVGYWPLTEGYGTTAYDHSGHGFTAHLGDEGAALTIPTWLPGNAAGGPTLQTPSGSFLMLQKNQLTASNATIPGLYLLPGYTYDARVRGELPQSKGEWSEKVPVEIPLQPGWYKGDSNAPWANLSFPAICLNYHDKMWMITNADGKSRVYSSADGKSWENISSIASNGEFPWQARSNAAGVVFNDKMWIIGGFASGKAVNDIWFSTDGKTWTPTLISNAWEPRYDMCCTIFKNRIWLFAGHDEKGKSFNDVWSSADGINWNQVNPTGAMWSPRNSAGAIAFNNRLWLFGGSDAHNNLLQDSWSTVDGINWTQSQQPAWQARSIPQVVGDENNTKLWLLGGIGVGGLTLADMWHSTDGVIWSWDFLQLPWFPRQGSCAVVFKNRIYILGGNAIQKTSQEVWYYQLPS